MTALSDDELQRLLGARVGRLHLRQRLGLEADHHTWVFARGRKLFHIENWYSSPRLIRALLRLAFLHGRARRNALAPQLRRQRVVIARLPAAFEGFKILHLSDLHLDMNAEFPAALAERVRGLDYDLCVLTGDFRYRTHGPFDATLAGLQRLRADLHEPIYGILGNHDSIRMVPPIEDLGIRMLVNEAVTIDRGGAAFNLVGVDDFHYFRAANLEQACRTIDLGLVSVLLSHTPEFYRHAAHAGFDLMLSGHTHGGQLCLPGGIAILTDADCPRRFTAGPWKHHGMLGYTSVGAGSSIVDLRLNCPPEVTIHELRRGDTGET